MIEWSSIFVMTGLVSFVTLLLLLAYNTLTKNLSFASSLSLALMGGIGFFGWFTIFNTFSLTGLNQDIPIPLFPISPEDIACGITVLLFTLLYILGVKTVSRNRSTGNTGRSFGLVALLLPALVALVIDIYFI